MVSGRPPNYHVYLSDEEISLCQQFLLAHICNTLELRCRILLALSQIRSLSQQLWTDSCNILRNSKLFDQDIKDLCGGRHRGRFDDKKESRLKRGKSQTRCADRIVSCRHGLHPATSSLCSMDHRSPHRRTEQT